MKICYSKFLENQTVNNQKYNLPKFAMCVCVQTNIYAFTYVCVQLQRENYKHLHCAKQEAMQRSGNVQIE